MKAEFKNTAIVIPAYNAEKYLAELISKISALTDKKNIIVINDASTDSTLDICKKLDLKVISHTHNEGKGAALLSGFREAVNEGYEFALTIDADLQHEPAEILNFLQKQQEEDFEMVIGCRDFRRGVMPRHRICSNTITSWMVSKVCSRKIYDSQSGYRLYKLNFLKDLKFVSGGYQFESEIIIKFARKGAEFGFIPIATIYNGQESHISNFRDITSFVKTIIREIFHKNGE